MTYWWRWWGSGSPPPDPAQALLNEAAVRFDFSQYTDVDDMVDVNGGWGPLGHAGSGTVTLTDTGIRVVFAGLASGVLNLQIDTIPGPIVLGADGMTLMSVVRVDVWSTDDTTQAVGGLFMCGDNADTSRPAFTGFRRIGYLDDLAVEHADDYTAIVRNNNPPGGTLLNRQNISTGVTAHTTGLFVSFFRLDAAGANLDMDFYEPNGHTAVSENLSSVPAFVADPRVIDYMDRTATLPADSTQSELDVWNRYLLDAEVDALIAHFTA
jgi:hypothetical protein